jgi:lipid-A-disaccharide synthase
MRIGIVAAEASGDLLGAGLIHALKQYYPDAEFVGIGGDAMQKAGCRTLYPITELSVMGILEVLKKLPSLLRIRYQTKQFFLKNRPDVYIGIDAPDFNLPIERALKTAGIPVVHYTSPTVWAWREKRLHTIAKSVNVMLTLFPFEAAFYERYGIPVRFVGHPLADKLPPLSLQSELRQQYGFPQNAPIVSILPGSRQGELSQIAPVFLQAAKRCLLKKPEMLFIAPMANKKRAIQFQHLLKHHAPDLPVKIVIQASEEAMILSDVVLVASGTATLEALLLNKPMVVGYKVPWLNYCIGKQLIKIDQFALPNLLAAAHLVPEFIQGDCEPVRLSQAILTQFEDLPLSSTLQTAYEHIRKGLTRDANQHAAKAVVQLLTLRASGESLPLL